MSIAKYIDHTNLKPTARVQDITKLCQEAMDYNFRAICIQPYRVPQARNILKGTGIKVVTVVGFPLGANRDTVKNTETIDIAAQGVDEIDLVWNLGEFKSGKYLTVMQGISRIINIATSFAIKIKIIVETSYLNVDEIKKAHQIVKDSGAEYIKTSTGFANRDDSAQSIWKKRQAVITWKLLGGLKIKAAGGIRDYQQARAFITAGAVVIGTSSSVKIVKEEDETLQSNPAPG